MSKRFPIRGVLAQNVRKRVEELNFPNMQALSVAAGVSQSMISSLVNERVDVRIQTLEKLAIALRTDEATLLSRGSGQAKMSDEDIELLTVAARYRALPADVKAVVRWLLFGNLEIK